MMMEHYVTSPVNVVTNAQFLILWNCTASRITMGGIASNSHRNMIGNVGHTWIDLFFGSGNALITLQPFYQGILNRKKLEMWSGGCENGGLEIPVWILANSRAEGSS